MKNVLGILGLLLAIAVAFPASATIINLEATINGAQANAGAGTGEPGTGSAWMEFNDITNEFSWLIVWQDLTGPVLVAHFHGPALPNQNAGVQVGIPDLTSPSAGSAFIDNFQAADLLAGLWYINIDTPAHPGGEIRGQVAIGGNGIPVPEPGTLGLLGVGLLGLLARRRKA